MELSFNRKEISILMTALADSINAINKEIGESLEAGNRQALAELVERRESHSDLNQRVLQSFQGNLCDCGCRQYIYA